MGLVTSTAFQQIPANLQVRLFIVIPTLVTTHVDDDVFYQVLVAFRAALAKADESNTGPIASMLRCIYKVIPALGESRYIGVLFWLAVALLQGSHPSYYAEASALLQATLKAMEKQGLFKNGSVQDVLLEIREPLEEVTSQLDDMLRLSFDYSFSFSLAAIIFKGLRHSTLKESAEAALRTLLEVTVASQESTDEILGYFIALLPVSTTLKDFNRLLKESGFDSAWDADGISDDEDDGSAPRLNAELLNIRDSATALLVASFAGSILSTAQVDDAEAEILYGLISTLAFTYPDIVSMMYAMIILLHVDSPLKFFIDTIVGCKIESAMSLPIRQIHTLLDRYRTSSE